MERFSLKNKRLGEICPETGSFYQYFRGSHLQNFIRRRDISFAILCTAPGYFLVTGWYTGRSC
jgi:hypothetical protein